MLFVSRKNDNEIKKRKKKSKKNIDKVKGFLNKDLLLFNSIFLAMVSKNEAGGMTRFYGLLLELKVFRTLLG